MSFLRKVVVFLAVLAAVPAATAGWLDLIQPYQGPKQDITTVVITANYQHPRLLAELMQAENRQPFLLIPAVQDVNQDVLYFCPVNNSTPALQVKKSDFVRFMRFINPSQVIVLGDERYVPESYVTDLEPYFSVSVMRGDWDRVAEQLGKALRLKELSNDYAELAVKLTAKKPLYQPEPVAPVKNQPAAQPPVEIGAPQPPSDTPVDPTVEVPGDDAAELAAPAA